MKNIFTILLFSIILAAQGQSLIDELKQKEPGKGTIKINQDENIATLLNARINEIKKEQMIDGFRINIFLDDSQNSKDKAMAVRSGFIAKYNYECEYIYIAPDSKLYVGNFRTKSEAMKAFNLIERDYPKAFIWQGKINLPDIE